MAYARSSIEGLCNIAQYINPWTDMFDRQRGQEYESLAYESIDTFQYRSAQKRSIWKRTQHRAIRITVTLAIGIGIGLFTIALLMLVDELLYVRILLYNYLYGVCDCVYLPVIVHILMSAGLVVLAATIVAVVEPSAHSSGVAAVKGYLNGVVVPRLLHFKTFIVTFVALVLGLVGGAQAGKEEPLAYFGAVYAGTLSQGKLASIGLDFRLLKRFRTDRERRDFVTIGAAAGISSAFGAPIGGVMWGIEEGSSWWSGPLTASTFFAGICGIVVVNVLLNGIYNGVWGNLSDDGVIAYAHYRLPDVPYTYTHIPFFIFLGICGGVLGAGYNHFFRASSAIRVISFGRSKILLIIEAFVMSVFSSAVVFMLIYFVDSCAAIGPIKDVLKIAELNYLGGKPYGCAEGEANMFASVFLQDTANLLKIVNAGFVSWQVSTLLIVGTVYLFMSPIWTGISIPFGSIVPLMIIGACFARAFGILVTTALPYLQIETSVFAIVGSAAMIAGSTRMTIALAILMSETVDNATYLLPTMIAILFAKAVGDFFSDGLYEIEMEMQSMPFVKFKLDRSMIILRASDVASTKLEGDDLRLIWNSDEVPDHLDSTRGQIVGFYDICRVRDVVNSLRACDHNGFPVVDGKKRLVGLILRFQLTVLLSHPEAFMSSRLDETPDSVPIAEFLKPYPIFPDIEDVYVSPGDMNRLMNLHDYLVTPMTVLPDCPLERIHRLFRLMGLHHVMVVDKQNHVLGVITRKDLCENVMSLKPVGSFGTQIDPYFVNDDRMDPGGFEYSVTQDKSIYRSGGAKRNSSYVASEISEESPHSSPNEVLAEDAEVLPRDAAELRDGLAMQKDPKSSSRSSSAPASPMPKSHG